MQSQIGQQMADFVHKMTLKIKLKKKNEKILRNESETNITDILSQKANFQKSFS